MVPLQRLKSAKRKKKISPADPKNSYFKRDVPAMVDEINKKLDKLKPVSDHFHDVLSKSKLGQKTAFGEHLIYKFKFNERVNELADHQYIQKSHFENNFLSINENKKLKKIETIIDQKLNCLDEVNQNKTEKSLNFEKNIIPETKNSIEVQDIVYNNKDIQYIDCFNEIMNQTKSNDLQKIT